MFSRFRPSTFKLNSVFTRRFAAKNAQQQVNPLYSENAVLFKGAPKNSETWALYGLSAAVATYATSVAIAHFTFLNPNIKVTEETPEEIEERKQSLEDLEVRLANKKINYPAYHAKKFFLENNDTYVKTVNNVIVGLIVSAGYAGAYAVSRVPKKIVTKIYKEKGKLYMKLYDTKAPVLLKENSFRMTTPSAKTPLKDMDACTFYVYENPEEKKANENKKFDLKHLYYISLSTGEYPCGYVNFNYFLNKK